MPVLVLQRSPVLCLPGPLRLGGWDAADSQTFNVVSMGFLALSTLQLHYLRSRHRPAAQNTSLDGVCALPSV